MSDSVRKAMLAIDRLVGLSIVPPQNMSAFASAMDDVTDAVAALSANGGEAVPVGYLSHVTLKTLADGKPVKLYPAASDWVCEPVYTHPAPPSVAVPEGCPDDIRALGLSVAVHNDYRLNGEHHTFWLFTDETGMSYKGEGRTDDEALNKVRAILTAAPQPDHTEEQ